MVRAELMTTRTAGIDTNHLTMFTILLVSRTPHMWTKVDTVQMAKYCSPRKVFASDRKIDTTF